MELWTKKLDLYGFIKSKDIEWIVIGKQIE